VIVDQPPKLTLTGFHLQQLQRADVGAWFRYLTDPQVYEHTSWAVTKPDDLLSLFEDYESPNLESSTVTRPIIEDHSDRSKGTPARCMSLCVLLRFQCRRSDEASEAGRPWIGCPKETLNVLEESLMGGLCCK
jgi:hypothetical protein